MKCPACNGTGKIKYIDSSFNKNLCNFCFGKKDIDWIEYIFGVTREGIDCNWSLKKEDYPIIETEILNKLSMDLTKEIDKEILNYYLGKHNGNE